MTVKELIQQLQTITDPNATVVLCVSLPEELGTDTIGDDLELIQDDSYYCEPEKVVWLMGHIDS